MFLSEHYIFFKSNIFNFAINNHADIKEKLTRFVEAILWYSNPDEESKEPEALLYLKMAAVKSHGSSGGKGEDDEESLKIGEDRDSSQSGTSSMSMSRIRLSSIQRSAMDSIIKSAGQHQEIILQRL